MADSNTAMLPKSLTRSPLNWRPENIARRTVSPLLVPPIAARSRAPRRRKHAGRVRVARSTGRKSMPWAVLLLKLALRFLDAHRMPPLPREDHQGGRSWRRAMARCHPLTGFAARPQSTGPVIEQRHATHSNRGQVGSGNLWHSIACARPPSRACARYLPPFPGNCGRPRYKGRPPPSQSGARSGGSNGGLSRLTRSNRYSRLDQTNAFTAKCS
jgi:hypothetical protein